VLLNARANVIIDFICRLIYVLQRKRDSVATSWNWVVISLPRMGLGTAHRRRRRALIESFHSFQRASQFCSVTVLCGFETAFTFTSIELHTHTHTNRGSKFGLAGELIVSSRKRQANIDSCDYYNFPKIL